MRINVWKHWIWEHLPPVFTSFCRKLICESERRHPPPRKHCITLRLKYLCVEHKATIKIFDGSRTVARETLLTMAL